MRNSLRPVLLTQGPGFVLLLLASTVLGQTPPRAVRVQQDIMSREADLTRVHDQKNRGLSDPPRKAWESEAREDFHQLQVANNEMMQRVFVQKSVDPKRILASLAEIKKRARRLKSNLGLSDFENNRSTQRDNSDLDTTAKDATLSSALWLVNTSVMDFVTSPLFQQPKVLDSGLYQQASKDLDQVIRLAEEANKLVRRLPIAMK